MAGAADSRGSREGSSSSEDHDFGVAIEGAGSSAGSESGPEPDSHDEASSPADESDQEKKGLFDLEASESGGSPDSHSDIVVHTSFPQFARLPTELRRQVWEAFCPALLRPSVYRFILVQNNGRGPMHVWEHAHLDQQTAAHRALMAINQDTRRIASAALPDTLTIRDGRRTIHFNKSRDVVYLDPDGVFPIGSILPENMAIPGFSEHIRHLAIDSEHFFQGRQLGFDMDEKYWPDLEAVYYVLDDANCHGRHLWWCVSEGAYQCLVEAYEEEAGLGEDLKLLYCWPNLKEHQSHAETSIPLKELIAIAANLDPEDENFDFDDPPLAGYAKAHGIAMWPMVVFMGDQSLERVRELTLMVESKVYEDSIGSVENADFESAPDEYESEGIDDDSIDEPSSNDDDGDDLAVLPMSDNVSSPGEFSPVEEDTIQAAVADPYSAAQFSSPEASSATAEASDNSDEEPTRTARQRKRRVVSSDSEDEPSDRQPKKRARVVSRRAIVSDEEDEQNTEDGPTGSRLRARLLNDEDEDEDDNEGDEEEEDEEGGALTGHPMSLAERLQLHRSHNPIPPSSDEESSSAAPSIRDYEDFQDDDQSDDTGDPGSEEEALSEDALVDGMAEESDDDDGGW